MSNKYLAIDCLTGGLSRECTLLEIYVAILDEQLNIVESFSAKIVPPTGQRYIVEADYLIANNIDLVKHSQEAENLKNVAQRLFRMLYNRTVFGRTKLIPIGIDIPRIAEIMTTILKKKNWDTFVTPAVILDVTSAAAHAVLKGSLPDTLDISLENLAKHFSIPFVNASLQSRVEATIKILKAI